MNHVLELANSVLAHDVTHESLLSLTNAIDQLEPNDAFSLLLYICQRPELHPLAINTIYHKLCKHAASFSISTDLLTRAISSISLNTIQLCQASNPQYITLIRFLVTRTADLVRRLFAVCTPHSAKLLPFIEALAECSGWNSSDLDKSIISALQCFVKYPRYLIFCQSPFLTREYFENSSRLVLLFITNFNSIGEIKLSYKIQYELLVSALVADPNPQSIDNFINCSINLLTREKKLLGKVINHIFHPSFKISICNGIALGKVAEKSNELARLLIDWLMNNHFDCKPPAKYSLVLLLSKIIPIAHQSISINLDSISRDFLRILTQSLDYIPFTLGHCTLIRQLYQFSQEQSNAELSLSCQRHMDDMSKISAKDNDEIKSMSDTESIKYLINCHSIHPKDRQELLPNISITLNKLFSSENNIVKWGSVEFLYSFIINSGSDIDLSQCKDITNSLISREVHQRLTKKCQINCFKPEFQQQMELTKNPFLI
ncbi:hypothetical protein P9112_005589 [Eukaryota sp. TZLM1-RC]